MQANLSASTHIVARHKVCKCKQICQPLHILLLDTKYVCPNFEYLNRNHGPVYGFWLFAFERMNGIAGSFHTNTHNIPIQIMRKLTSMQSTDSSLWPSEFQNEFSSLLHEH